MKDIQKAIQAQHKYRQALETNPFTANIYEYLAPYGYTDLDEFTSDKIKYLLKNSKESFYKSECKVEEILLDGDNPQHRGIMNNFTNYLLGKEELMALN